MIVVAAAYCHRLAGEFDLKTKAVVRATHPDRELSPQAGSGLAGNGIVGSILQLLAEGMQSTFLT